MALACSLLIVSLIIIGAHGFILSSSTSARLRRSLQLQQSKLLDSSVYDTIQNGKIGIIPEFLPANEIAALQRDAASLHQDGLFSTDALASYGKSGSFDPTKDRAVLKLQQWKNDALGDATTRHHFANRLAALREDLALNLNRPALLRGDSVTKYGFGSTEISYTRFGPGAFLKRHVDEHHEELKGRDGWSKPTRRSLSWLIYLQDKDWNSDRNGGCLRCYERSSPTAKKVGARGTGDLQIAWLRPCAEDAVERPVFMDSSSGQNGCAMYIDSPEGGEKMYITDEFNSHPTLYMAGGEVLAQKLLVTRPDYAKRFHFIEPPKSVINDLLSSSSKSNDDEIVHDVEPLGGTLVIFDSVALPHEVLATVGKERWATSGWMHEDQQPAHYHHNNV